MFFDLCGGKPRINRGGGERGGGRGGRGGGGGRMRLVLEEGD